MTVLYYVLLLIHVLSILGALAIALKSLIKGGPAKGLWHASLAALIAGIALVAVLSTEGGVNHTKIGVKFAIAAAVLVLSLLVAQREKQMAAASALPDAVGQGLDDTSTLESISAEIAAEDDNDDDEIPMATPEEMRRRLLIGVAVGLIANVLIALLW
ncbi:hypothetical protein SAMN06298212_10190 [Ruaniaceae bacterium KH17]|nr:hypothetical protein SAMN06298212_10190 [Ruaniaceae bacterium KH17]